MALRKVAEIELVGERLDLARNGEGFHLVRSESPDVYGRPVAVLVPLAALTPSHVQALVDLVGELTVRLQGQMDLQRAASGKGECES